MLGSISNDKSLSTLRSLKVLKLESDLRKGTEMIKSLSSGYLSSDVSSCSGSVGLELFLKGRLNGVRRARVYVEREGGIAGNSLCKSHRFSNSALFTKWGVWELKVSVS